MTPGVNAAKKANITYYLHEYSHEPNFGSYGLEAAQKLNVQTDRVFKTLMVKLDNQKLVVAIVPVSSSLSMKRIAKATGAKKATMAVPEEAERATGYVLGGVSPLGQKRSHKTIIDDSAKAFLTIFVSAGRKGLEIELSAQDLANITKAEFASITQV